MEDIPQSQLDLEAQHVHIQRNTNTNLLPQTRLWLHRCDCSRKRITVSTLFTIVASLSLVWYIRYLYKKMTVGSEYIFTRKISGQLIGEIQIQTSSSLYSSCCFSWYGLSWRVYWLRFTGHRMAGLWRWRIRCGMVDGHGRYFLLLWWYYGYLAWSCVERLHLYSYVWRFLRDGRSSMSVREMLCCGNIV